MGKLIEKIWKHGEGRRMMAAFCAHTVSISIGITQGYSAIWLPQLSTSKEYDINPEQSSWLASLGAISNPLGSIMSGILAEVLGRKLSIQISSIPFIAGWILIGFSRNIYWLYIGRLITGIAGGMSTASFTYVGEVATPKTRGFLQTFGPISASFGILLVYVLGYFISWRAIALISISFAILTAITIQPFPDSPDHLMKTHVGPLTQQSPVYKAYKYFNKNIAVLEEEVKRMAKCRKSGEVLNNDGKTLKELCLSAETVKPFFLLVILFLLQELSGIYTILYYAVQFIGETNLQINDYISSILVGTIRFAMSILCAILIQRIGRKTLCTFSSFGMTFSVLILGLYIKYYEINPNEPRILNLLPLFCIVLNVFFSMMGMLPIPWVLVGEMFPLRVRPIMAGIVICIAQCFIFLCVKMYNNMVDQLGFSGTIFTFFVASTLAMLFSKYILPETRDKTLEEIEAYFRNDKKDKKLTAFENQTFTISSENISVLVSR